MVKRDIVERVYRVLGLSRKESSFMVDEFFKLLKESLKAGEDVKISGFGVFAVKNKGERRGRNPQTGEEMVIKARRVVKFRPSSVLRRLLNEKDLSEDR